MEPRDGIMDELAATTKTVKVYCSTSNSGKLSEFRLIAAELGSKSFDVQPMPGIDNIEPCEETGTTFLENAILKARYYGSNVSGLLFAEDSGLVVDALGGDPGVYSARWSGPGGDDESNNRLLLERLAGNHNRLARFVCEIALSRQGEIVQTFREEVEGVIADAPKGSQGFGYDPLFYYPPLKCTFAELAPEEKLQVSHRGKAVKLLFQYLEQIAR